MGTPVTARAPLPHVVVVGAGFGGLAAVAELAGAPVTTTLVDCRYYNTFQPLLYQVATGGLNPGDIAYPLRSLLRSRPDLDFRCGEAETVDLDGRVVTLKDGGTLGYDYLVLATGATTNYFGIEGAVGHTSPIYTLDDSLEVRRRMFAQLERAAAEGPEAGALTVVVIGGGATGVEMAGALAELRAMALGTTYRGLDPSMSQVVLVEQRDRLLGGFDERLAEYALAELRRRGVEVLLGTAVQEVAEDHLVLAGGARAGRLGCGLVVWAAGVGPGDLAARLEVAKARGGRLAVEPNLALPGHKEAFAVGDIAGAPAGPDEGAGVLPQLAQPAIQGGRHAAREIVRQLAGLGPLEFRYHDKGILATIGRRSAVAEIPLPRPFTGRSLRLRGTLAWLAWLVLHVVVLLGRRNRAAVLLNWAWRYVAWRRGPRVIVGG